MDCGLPVSCVMGFLRQEYWSGLPFSTPGDLIDPGIELMFPALADGLFNHWATWEAQKANLGSQQNWVKSIDFSPISLMPTHAYLPISLSTSWTGGIHLLKLMNLYWHITTTHSSQHTLGFIFWENLPPYIFHTQMAGSGPEISCSSHRLLCLFSYFLKWDRSRIQLFWFVTILPLSVSLTPGPGVCLDLSTKAAVFPAGHSALKSWRLGEGESLILFLSVLTVSCLSMLFYIMSFSLELPVLQTSTRHRGNSFKNFLTSSHNWKA